ncbi:MAG TPA: hypothetical protein VF635_06795 [Propionibacteriaceae bacterium]
MSDSLSRRGFLAVGLGAAATVGLSACGDGSSNVPGAGGQAPAGNGGASGYSGPPVTLQFWNGLSGGDVKIM